MCAHRREPGLLGRARYDGDRSIPGNLGIGSPENWHLNARNRCIVVFIFVPVCARLDQAETLKLCGAGSLAGFIEMPDFVHHGLPACHGQGTPTDHNAREGQKVTQ